MAQATPPVVEATADIAPPVTLTVGKSTLLRLPAPIERISIGNPNVLDVTLTSPRELYLLGKAFGASNVMLWRKGGSVTVIDVNVVIDTSGLQSQLAAILPEERGIVVRSASDSVVLSGTVSSAMKADRAVAIADGFARASARTAVAAGAGIGAGGAGGGAASSRASGSGTQPQVINLMTVNQPQQVMLEVKVAEVSRSLLDQMGISLNLSRVSGSVTWGIITQGIQDAFGSLVAVNTRNGNRATVDGKYNDGLVKVLAEPTIVSISGQEASFLAGGKVFIPVSRANNQTGGVTITLEEKEFGVGLKFTPVVLDGDLINLRVAPEVSELSRTGSPFVTAGGATTVLPSFTTRRAETTVQLRDGETLAIAGLIKNNITENINRFPFLGEIPVLGALFRSTEFQTDRTELLFVITPRLIKSVAAAPRLPTDSFVPPSRTEMLLNGQLEGSGRVGSPAPKPPADDLKVK
jgi:pilus assembly protein CpaC